jgi:hypothetical protein
MVAMPTLAFGELCRAEALLILQRSTMPVSNATGRRH